MKIIIVKDRPAPPVTVKVQAYGDTEGQIAMHAAHLGRDFFGVLDVELRTGWQASLTGLTMDGKKYTASVEVKKAVKT